jgi:hypothetical protein
VPPPSRTAETWARTERLYDDLPHYFLPWRCRSFGGQRQKYPCVETTYKKVGPVTIKTVFDTLQQPASPLMKLAIDVYKTQTAVEFLDRYFYSSIAYQGSRGANVVEVEMIMNQVPYTGCRIRFRSPNRTLASSSPDDGRLY